MNWRTPPPPLPTACLRGGPPDPILPSGGTTGESLRMTGNRSKPSKNASADILRTHILREDLLPPAQLHFASWPASDAAIPTKDTCPTSVCEGDHREILVQSFRFIYFQEYISPSLFLNPSWSALKCEHNDDPKCVMLTRLVFPADAYKYYVTTYRDLPHTCHEPPIQAC